MSTKIEILSSEFISGAPKAAALPLIESPEIALVGRSNSGKSTLLNRLTGRHKLARTGRTPGQTREINLFDVRYRSAATDAHITLADLPGFGYAKRSKSERLNFERLLVDYIEGRPTLQTLCLLNDSKRVPEEEELAVRNFAFNAGLYVLILVTKTDRLSQKETHHNFKAIADGYGLEVGDLVPVGSQLGVETLWERILAPLAS